MNVKRIVFIFLFCVGVYFTAQKMVVAKVPAQADHVLDIQELRSDKDVPIWLVEDHSLPIISVNFVFQGTGSVNDPEDKQGLSRVFARMLTEGSGDMDSRAFKAALENNSISLGFGSGRDTLSGSLKTLRRNKDKAFGLLKLALEEPRFEQQALERVVSSALVQVKAALTNPSWIASRIMNDRAFAGHPYAMNSGGTLSTLPAIQVDDLKAFQQYLSLDRLKVAVVGDISADEAKTIVDDVFAALPVSSKRNDNPRIDIRNAGTVALVEKDIPQTVVQMYQTAISNDHPDYHLAKVMNYIYGGGGFGTRLMVEAREKRGLTYGIYSFVSSMNYADILGVSCSTKNETVKDILQIVREEAERMREKEVSDEELSTAKEYLIGSLVLEMTSTDAISELMVGLMADDLPVDYLDQRERAIRAATKEDIMRVAKEILSPDSFTTVLVGSPEGVTPDIVIDQLPNVE